MKKQFFVLAAISVSFILYSFTLFNQPGEEVSSPGHHELSIPDDVQQIIDNHCFGCHNTDSRNDKGKGKLKFDKFPFMRKSKQIGKLGKIAEVIKEDEMPPHKFIEKKPKAALSAEQKTTLINWAEFSLKSLAE